MEPKAVLRGDISIPLTVSGTGPTAVFVPGLSSTQADLASLITDLRGFLRLVTFDLRGHGVTSSATDYGYDAFAGDVAAALDEVSAEGPVLLIGYSFGADLALDWAADHQDSVTDVVLIDGATPLSGPFLADDELAMMRAALDSEEARAEQRELEDTPRRHVLTADDVVALQREIDTHRQSTLPRFDRIERPVTMIMSETMAGTEGDRARELNDTWREAVDDLAAARPSIAVHRIAAGHELVFSHPGPVAAIIRKCVDTPT